MKFEQIKEKEGAISGNPYLDAWLTGQGYDKESIKKIDQPEHDPALLPGVGKASQMIHDAIEARQIIVVSGDYDCDGICGTTILVKGLLKMGAIVDYMIPDRLTDGYGMNVRMVEKAHEEGASMIITVDNGIACHEAIARAKDLGMQVILTDHHAIPETLPSADVVVHAALPGYPYKDISGAETAYKLMQFCFKQNRIVDPALEDYMACLAGLTVISDVMPLLDENRTIFRRSVQYLKDGRSPNLACLLEVADIDPEHIDEITYGFSICPIINAIGRISNAEHGVAYLLLEDKEKMYVQAAALLALNTKRKEMLKNQVQNVMDLVDDSKPGIVLFNEDLDLHEGLIGIVAGRVCDQFKKPAILFTKAAGPDGPFWKASARSTEDVDIYKILCTMADQDPELFLRFGGHAGAAGMSIPYKKKEEFEKLFQKAVADGTSEYTQMYVEVPAVEVYDMLEAMKPYAPWGNGFPKPVIHTEMKVKSAKCYFKSGSALLSDNDCLELWDRVETFLPQLKHAGYRMTWDNYDKLLKEGDEDPASNKTEYYRPGGQMLVIDMFTAITNNWFAGKEKPQMDIIERKTV